VIGKRLGVLALVAVSLLAGAATPAVTAQSDPHLEPGFPISTLGTGGIHQSGPVLHTLVGEIDGDAQLEIVVSALASGPMYAWNHDGTPVPGWPLPRTYGAGYAGLGQLAGNDKSLEVVVGYFGFGHNNGTVAAYDGDGSFLPGWPRGVGGAVSNPAALVDVDGDGIDEVFTAGESWSVIGYRAQGRQAPGWPSPDSNARDMHMPATGDLDGDGDVEIVSASGYDSAGLWLHAYHHTGKIVKGFPVHLTSPSSNTFPVMGDVDGDGRAEIVVIADAGRTGEQEGAQNDQSWVSIVSHKGEIEREIPLGSFAWGSAPALADLAGDAAPEIVLSRGNGLVAMRGDGTPLPGWPVSMGDFGIVDSSPVVGDVNGDGRVDVAVTVQNWYTHESQVRAYGLAGSLLPGFPKSIEGIGSGGVPAIADVDLDGRNELVVSGSNWSGSTGPQERVWVFDLRGPGPYGPIPWGQLGGGPHHRNAYPAPATQWPPSAAPIRGHERDLTLRMRRHLVLKGRLKSDFRPCVKDVPVRVTMWLGSQWGGAYVGARTSTRGRFRIELDDRTEKFRVSVPFSYRGKDDNEVCLRAHSKPRTHRH
jgi:hypothetical protein